MVCKRKIQKIWRAGRDRLTRRCSALKEEVKEVEQIRKGGYSILRQKTHRGQPKKTQDLVPLKIKTA